MDGKKWQIGKQKRNIVWCSLFLFVVANLNLQAQVVIGENIKPQSYSVLEVISNGKGGLRLPRLTTEQRDQLTNDTTFLDVKKDLARGLTIYNLDSNCTEYWNGSGWISLCQNTVSPAEINLPDCDKIHVYGTYSQNAPLNNDHYVTLPVTITKKGSYYFLVSSNNGYYFQSSGIFETTGSFEIRLNGAGTPLQDGIDTLIFSRDNASIETQCHITVNVDEPTMGYRADCNKIQVFGTYQTQEFETAENYVKIPINVIITGRTTFETDHVNGIKFTVDQNLTKLDQDTLILKAQGIPKKSGKYRFSFTTDGSIKNTCDFEITFFSFLGSFNDPACKCLDIYEERPDAKNGEYWLMNCEAKTDKKPVKTYCDLENGGWTLVWSFSEKTARSIYKPANSIEVSGSAYSVFNDVSLNKATDENDTINYANYRLSRDEWQNFPNSTSRPQLKARITENPTDMNDEWALNNYGIVSPRNTYENPIESSFAGRGILSQGKIFGKKWEVKIVNGVFQGSDEMSGNHANMDMYNNATYCTHWNFGRLGSNAPFQVIPNQGGNDNTISIININNAFGWFGETEVNHHFGKCGGLTANDFDFTTKTCSATNLYPHSFNNGEGRYLQWFVR
jgi:hypothetical protein